MGGMNAMPQGPATPAQRQAVAPIIGGGMQGQQQLAGVANKLGALLQGGGSYLPPARSQQYLPAATKPMAPVTAVTPYSGGMDLTPYKPYTPGSAGPNVPTSPGAGVAKDPIRTAIDAWLARQNTGGFSKWGSEQNYNGMT